MSLGSKIVRWVIGITMIVLYCSCGTIHKNKSYEHRKSDSTHTLSIDSISKSRSEVSGHVLNLDSLDIEIYPDDSSAIDTTTPIGKIIKETGVHPKYIRIRVKNLKDSSYKNITSDTVHLKKVDNTALKVDDTKKTKTVERTGSISWKWWVAGIALVIGGLIFLVIKLKKKIAL